MVSRLFSWALTILRLVSGDARNSRRERSFYQPTSGATLEVRGRFRPIRLPLSFAAALVLAAVAAPGASAADTTLATDPIAQRVTALAGTVVWVSGRFPNQTLMQHTASGTAPVKGAPRRTYTSIDLGRDAGNRLLLTYLRCVGTRRCLAFRDDLKGHRTVVRSLALKRCSLTTAPSVWRTRTAFGLACTKGTGSLRRNDPRRSGLYVKTAAGATGRLPLPTDAVKFGINRISLVDLRSTAVAAVAADVFEYAFTQTIAGKQRRSFLAAASEGDSNEEVRGLALGSGGAMWTLVDSEHAGDPNLAIIHRLTGACLDSERLPNLPGDDEESGFRAVGLAADGRTLHLAVPDLGIVTHPFEPEGACREIG
ncbi:MAG: hypothetical protein H0V22_03385 [Solirubrobacterales bacterium]|nr:hypothetical protein [Solirubrobacterales bacterium]